MNARRVPQLPPNCQFRVTVAPNHANRWVLQVSVRSDAANKHFGYVSVELASALEHGTKLYWQSWRKAQPEMRDYQAAVLERFEGWPS